ncbi:MAG: hypothetical protein N2248_00435 [candidate division WOR-3 bacterium]|nr:hypothetical protein [candidate division WOR-3 bacterium]
MLTAEKFFCQELRLLWPSGVTCTVAYPDELWVRDTNPDAVCVYTDEITVISGASDRLPVPTGKGEQGQTTIKRLIGECHFILIITIRTQLESRLNDLSAQFLNKFRTGFIFGDQKQFQISGQIIGNRVPPRLNMAQRLCERVFRVPVTGPFEETGEAWPVEEVKVNVNL